MSKEINIAVIGTGTISRVLCTHIMNISGANLVAVADINSEVVKRTKRVYNVKNAYTNYRDLLKQSDVDFVIISTPPSTHAEIAVDAAKAGKHIFVEKPIAATLGDADRILQAVATAGVKLMVGEDVRFNPIFAYAHRLVRKGKIGRPIMMKANRRSCAVWWRKPELEPDNFIECIQNDREPLVSGEDGKKDLEIAIAAHLSITSHNPVQLPLNKEETIV